MGVGETQMRTWAYIGSSFGLIVAVFSFILALLTIIMIKGSVSNDYRDDLSIFAIVVVIIGALSFILCSFAITKIYKTDELYTKVALASFDKSKKRVSAPVDFGEKSPFSDDDEEPRPRVKNQQTIQKINPSPSQNQQQQQSIPPLSQNQQPQFI